MKPYKVVYKDLSSKNVYGYAVYAKKGKPARIEVDETLKGCRHLETLVHETIHLVADYLDEVAVTRMGAKIATQLWASGYRQIADKGPKK